MAYNCEQCNSSFPKLKQLLEHRKVENHLKKYICSSCNKVFKRKQNLDRHMKKHADENTDALEAHLHLEHGLDTPKHKAVDQEGGGPVKKRRVQDTSHDFFTIREVGEKHIEKFKTKATYYKIDITDLEVKDLPTILETLQKIFQSILDILTEDIPSSDFVRVNLDNPQLDFPIVLPFMKRSELTVDILLQEIERVLQSNQQFVVDETFGIELMHVKSVSGSGYKMKQVVDITEMLKKKKSIIQIKNTDSICCARAIMTAKARLEKDPKWESIRHGCKIQKRLALELHEKAGVPLKPCGLEEVKKFQSVLPDYQIFVLSKEHFNAFIFEGREGGIPIYLYSHDNHYDIITKMPGFLNRNYFCVKCKKGYQHKERHSCNNPCRYCRHLHANTKEDWQHCQSCNCYFVNQECLRQHMKKTDQGKSTCETIYKCKECSQLVNRSKHKRPHVCGEKHCKTCKDYFAEGHQCFIQPHIDEELTGQKQIQYIFFDFECTQDNQVACEEGYLPGAGNVCVNCRKSWCGSMEHRPNMCVVHKVCDLCMHSDITSSSKCLKCGVNEHVFSGINTTTQFCKWLFSEENRKATVICHNFKGYDSYPILKYLHDNAILPEVITTGSKYMSVTVPKCKIRFIDSLNFIPMALADMPEAFGESELAKGFFPHLYNRTEKQHSVIDHLPDMEYYNPNGMKPEYKSKFTTWYEQHYHDTFDFQVELLKYCRSDVDVLRKCCLKFRDLFMDLTTREGKHGIDPFENCITIASACHLVFRTLFLEPETIGIIPPDGYRAEAKQSLMAYQWLSFLAHTQSIRIQHGRNGGEKKIGPYKVDGYYKTEHGKGVVLEFHGCFWHGCPKCFSRSTVNSLTESTMEELYDKTQEKMRYLKSLGFEYTSIWECDFRAELKTNPVMHEYINSLDIVMPLEPRDAFYGGRTEAFRLYEQSAQDQKIKYYDVTSLYPFVNKTGKIPLGHPRIITKKFDALDKYEGLVKCKVIPPRGLYTPVLPVKCNGKLLFTLCRLCAEQHQQPPCQHTESERAFVGTWVTDEIKMALSKGYRILKIYEVWHFQVSQYNVRTKTGGLFTEYVNTFLKVKQEASGWPDWCVDEDKKQQYIQQYLHKEGIKLEYQKIKYNPGLRSLAKLMLNSFWGKFGQRTNLTQSKYLTDPKEFMDMVTSDKQEVKNIRFVNDETVQLDWVYKNDFIEPSSRTNVVIAAYTTAQARLKLYRYLEPLGDRVLYCDTDSVVFSARSGEWEPPLGDYLGDLTDEVPNNAITTFITGGPKNYAYTLEKPTKNGQTSVCKVRGITLNFKNLIDINFNTMKRLVKSKSVEMVKVTNKNKIVRNPEVCNVLTKTEEKNYRIVFDKRVLTEDYGSEPYGF